MENFTPLFTVATITYNSEKWVRQAIESVLASSFLEFEFLISDDCSTDNTWNIIEQYNDPRIKAWRNDLNIGEYPNRNKVLAEAKGKYLLFVDGDDILYKYSLEMLNRYIGFFPKAAAFWGVYPLFFDFVTLPYEFNNAELTKLNYLSNYPVSITGFAESIFHVEALIDLGGFSNEFAIGDYYIKKKICLYHSVVLFPAGISFWRKSSNQSSSNIKKNYLQFVENMQIDFEILYDIAETPLNKIELKNARKNYKISRIKLLVSNTLLKFRLKDFILLMLKLKIPVFHLFFVFQKGKYPLNEIDKESPLQNHFHF